jgi:hypothetical protein
MDHFTSKMEILRQNKISLTNFYVHYILTNNPTSAYVLHILNNKHDYGTVEESSQLLKPCYKGTRMNCWETFYVQILHQRRSQWPRDLRCRSSAARLLALWVRIPPGTWIFVCCERCVLSGRGLCDGLITRQEESYRL